MFSHSSMIWLFLWSNGSGWSFGLMALVDLTCWLCNRISCLSERGPNGRSHFMFSHSSMIWLFLWSNGPGWSNILACLLAWLLPGLLGCPTPIGGHHPHHLLAATTTQLEFGLISVLFYEDCSVTFRVVWDAPSHQKGTLVLSKGTLVLLNRNSYYQKGTHQKGTLVLSKGTLVLSKGTLILLNRNSYY